MAWRVNDRDEERRRGNSDVDCTDIGPGASKHLL